MWHADEHMQRLHRIELVNYLRGVGMKTMNETLQQPTHAATLASVLQTIADNAKDERTKAHLDVRLHKLAESTSTWRQNNPLFTDMWVCYTERDDQHSQCSRNSPLWDDAAAQLFDGTESCFGISCKPRTGVPRCNSTPWSEYVSVVVVAKTADGEWMYVASVGLTPLHERKTIHITTLCCRSSMRNMHVATCLLEIMFNTRYTLTLDVLVASGVDDVESFYTNLGFVLSPLHGRDTKALSWTPPALTE